MHQELHAMCFSGWEAPVGLTCGWPSTSVHINVYSNFHFDLYSLFFFKHKILTLPVIFPSENSVLNRCEKRIIRKSTVCNLTQLTVESLTNNCKTQLQRWKNTTPSIGNTCCCLVQHNDFNSLQEQQFQWFISLHNTDSTSNVVTSKCCIS